MIFFDFLKWYYIVAPLELLSIWRNFLAFSFDFFGISYHAKTFFRPWRLIVVRFEEKNLVQAFLFNLSSRIIGSLVGMMVRSVTIGFGLLTTLFVFIAGIFIEVLWLFLPFILMYLFWQGLSLLI